MNDIFDKIIAHEIPRQTIYEDDICIAVMDKFPVIPGQILVIPKVCIDYFGNLDDETFIHIMGVSKQVAKALDKTYNTLRTCILIEGFEVPHVHVKLYPVTRREFHIHGGKEASDEELTQEAEKIKVNLE